MLVFYLPEWEYYILHRAHVIQKNLAFFFSCSTKYSLINLFFWWVTVWFCSGTRFLDILLDGSNHCKPHFLPLNWRHFFTGVNDSVHSWATTAVLIDDCIVSGVDGCKDGTGFATLAYTCCCLTLPPETWLLLEPESESSITRIMFGAVWSAPFLLILCYMRFDLIDPYSCAFLYSCSSSSWISFRRKDLVCKQNLLSVCPPTAEGLFG